MNKNLKNIAVVVSGLDEEYQHNIICGINKAARENRFNVSYFAAFGGMIKSKRFDIGEYSIYNLIDFSGFDGAILMTNTISDPDVKESIISRVKDSGIPAVVFDDSDCHDFYNICINNSSPMEDVVRHVIQEHGATVVNFISGPLANPEALSRYNAFRKVMDENRLRIDPRRIYYGTFRQQDGKAAIEEFALSGMKLPDAFICANDAMALTAVSALEKLGYRVPNDVIVTGFDCTYNARNFIPSLTTVKRPLTMAGKTACATLAKIFSGGNPEKIITLDAHAVFAESCGCKDSSSDDFIEYKKNTYNHLESINTNLSLLNRLTAALADTETSEELFDSIEELVEELGCEKFSLCLTEGWQDAFDNISDGKNNYAPYITAPLIWDNGKRRSVGVFESNQMYPEKFESGGNISYFLPLHFRERCLGYYIISNGDFPIESLLCHTMTMNISNSIENIRKLLHLGKAMNELNQLYVIDPLCNIYNRNGFINIVDDIFKDCIVHGKKIMLTFIDMDGLKFINDNYGHNEGDFAIQRLANVIKDCCSNNSVCARFGGDEFVIFSSGISDSSADALERRFNTLIESMNCIIKKPYTLSASLGSIITEVGPNDTLYGVIKQADEKMYEVKKSRKLARKSEKIC